MIWVEFIICAAALIWTATLLSKYGDVLAEKTKLGGAWIGAILLAGVTSLPEMASGVSAVAWLGAPNLAAGAVLGSCLFNIALIALMDIVYQPGAILSKAQESHILAAGFGILLLGLIVIGVLIGPAMNGTGLLGISIISIIVFILYAAGARMIARLEQKRLGEVLEEEARAENYAQISLHKTYAMFILSAVTVVGLGFWLSYIGDQLSATTGLSRSFVGNLFLAASTSLPEVAASMAAVRIGAIDMAIANVLGSNLFNIMLFAIYDIADGRGNFWQALNNANAFAAIAAIMMTSVVIISLIYRASPRTPYRITWDGFLLLGMYLSSIAFLYWIG